MGAEELEYRELVFSGRLAGLWAPVSAGLIRRVVIAGAILFAAGGLTILPYLVGWTDIERANYAGLAVVSAVAFTGSAFMLTLRNLAAESLERLFPPVGAAVFLSVAILLGFATVYVGPTFGGVSAFYVHTPLIAFILMRTRWAVVTTVLTCIGFAIGLLIVRSPAGAQLFINVLMGAIAVAVLVGGLARGLERTRSQEHATRNELDRLNGRLRRFLAPQVAEVVISEGAQLAPHRQDIAVCFVDLRGFTNFTNAVSADTVVQVLTAYYAAVGPIVDKHNATIGGFDGDGVFAYLGDPVPNPNAPADALAMAKGIACVLDELVVEWSVAEATLGYGIGLAFGEATVGLMGFENRFDYTPVGAVVNLAARLCADAKHGEILVDNALRRRVDLGDRVTRRADVDLKGFGVTETYAVAH